MLDATGKKLIRFLQPDQPTELRTATLRVVSELGLREPEVAEALDKLIQDADSGLRVAALTAIGQLRFEKALPDLLRRVSEGGIEAEAAAQAAAHLGAKATRALQELMGQVAPGLRRRIASALGVGGTSSAGNAAIDALLDSDPGVVNAAARSLLSEVPSLSEAQKRSLADHVLEIVSRKGKARVPPESESALLRLLAGLGDARGEAVFWARLDSAYPPELRSAALQAVGTLPPPQSKEKLKLLFQSAGDPDFRVAAPALMLLKSLPVSDRNVSDWLALLDAPDTAARRFAMEKLAGRDTPDLADRLLRQLTHPDRGLRDAARTHLVQMKAGREALINGLLDAADADAAWNLARAQAGAASAFSPAVRARLFKQACAYLESADRRADPLLFLLREIDARSLRDDLEERALALRKKKKYAAAHAYLRLLARDPACAESVRFELAATGLVQSEHDLALDARTADASLQQFARLIHNHETAPSDRLAQARWLGPEDLFYLGFHFAEGDKLEREFARAALQLLIERSPRSKVAKDAKRKLRSAGLA